MAWTNWTNMDLTRVAYRVSVPDAIAHQIPRTPAVYAIRNPLAPGAPAERIIDIGMAGLRRGKGVRGRLASAVAHSACERIATAHAQGVLQLPVEVSCWILNGEAAAKSLEAGLMTLFNTEFHRLPMFNHQPEPHEAPQAYEQIYQELKAHSLLNH